MWITFLLQNRKVIHRIPTHYPQLGYPQVTNRHIHIEKLKTEVLIPPLYTGFLNRPRLYISHSIIEYPRQHNNMYIHSNDNEWYHCIYTIRDSMRIRTHTHIQWSIWSLGLILYIQELTQSRTVHLECGKVQSRYCHHAYMSLQARLKLRIVWKSVKKCNKVQRIRDKEPIEAVGATV